MRLALLWLGSLLLLGQVHEVAAQQPAPAYSVSARIGGALGIARKGLGFRGGLSGEYWFSPAMGVGLTAALLQHTEIIGDESNARALGLLAALRGADHGHYAYFGLGVGYARVKHEESPGLCLGDNGTCADYRVLRYHGVYVSAALGWLLHPRGASFEIGPILRFDMVADPHARVPADFAVSLGGELGFAL